jgi:hypothetical protein
MQQLRAYSDQAEVISRCGYSCATMARCLIINTLPHQAEDRVQ